MNTTDKFGIKFEALLQQRGTSVRVLSPQVINIDLATNPNRQVRCLDKNGRVYLTRSSLEETRSQS